MNLSMQVRYRKYATITRAIEKASAWDLSRVEEYNTKQHKMKVDNKLQVRMIMIKTKTVRENYTNWTKVNTHNEGKRLENFFVLFSQICDIRYFFVCTSR